MPKLTVSEKNETDSKKEYSFQDKKSDEVMLETSSLSIAKPDLIEIELSDTEKTEKKDDEGQRKEMLNNQTSAQTKFNEYLSEAINEALTSLGEPVKNTIYFQLENNFNIPKNEIPTQIDEFTDILHKIFGLGASRLEIKFMKNLHSKMNVDTKATEYEWPLSKWIIDDMSFTEYVNSARKSYCNLQ